MFCKQHPKTVVGAALVLLLSASADLFGDAVDLGGFAGCSSDSDVELHEYLAPDGAPPPNLPEQSSPQPEQHHVDDCFCCSHCVQHSNTFLLTRGETLVLFDRDSTTLNIPVFVQELLRPPQAS